MSFRTKFIALGSFVIGLYILLEENYFSGMNPILDSLMKIIILLLLILVVIQISKEPKKKRMIGIALLISSICLGFLGSNISDKSPKREKPRIYVDD